MCGHQSLVDDVDEDERRVALQSAESDEAFGLCAKDAWRDIHGREASLTRFLFMCMPWKDLI